MDNCLCVARFFKVYQFAAIIQLIQFVVVIEPEFRQENHL